MDYSIQCAQINDTVSPCLKYQIGCETRLGNYWSDVLINTRLQRLTLSDVFSAVTSHYRSVTGEIIKHQVRKQLLFTPSSCTCGKLLSIYHKFILINRVNIPQVTSEFAINAAYKRYWDKATLKYIDNCQQGEDGIRRKNFGRWDH